MSIVKGQVTSGASTIFPRNSLDNIVESVESSTKYITSGGKILAEYLDIEISSATENSAGIIQIATSAEVTSGANSTKAVVPSTLKTELDKKQDSITGGYRLTVTGTTIDTDRYMPIETVDVSGASPSVTVMAGHAYKIMATNKQVTINTETVGNDVFGLEGHAEIFVAGIGNIKFGQNIYFADALEPDSVNNCTIRFHDGKALISVEDHIAGHVVTVNAISGANTLNYWLAQPNTAGDDSTQYISFDASLDGQDINIGGATTYNAEKHVVGNGYTRTILTGGINCTAKTTFSDLGLNNVVVSSGTLTLGDAYIPSGSTVAVSSGGSLAIEKVTGNGGTIEHGRSIVSATVASAASVTFLSCGVDNTSNINGGAFCISSGGSLYASGVTFDACSSTRGGAFYVNDSACKATLVGCSAVNCFANAGRVMAFYGGSGILTDCYFSGNRTADNVGAIVLRRAVLDVSGCIFDDDKICVENTSSSTLNLIGSNHFSGTVSGDATARLNVRSGAIIDLTGNTNATPINPGGKIFIGSDVQIYPSAGLVSAVEISGGTYAAITKDAVLMSPVQIESNGVVGGNATVDVSSQLRGDYFTCSGLTFINPVFRSIQPYKAQSDSFISCSFVGNGTPINGFVNRGSVTLLGCSFESGFNIGCQSSCSITLEQTNRIEAISRYGDESGTVLISSGAIVDLTGNTNASPINPGGGVIVDGGCTVINSAGASVSIAGGTYTQINNDGTTE